MLMGSFLVMRPNFWQVGNTVISCHGWQHKHLFTVFYRNKMNFFTSDKKVKRFKGLVAWCHSFCLFSYFWAYTFIRSHSYNIFIRRHLPGPLSISSSPYKLSGKTLPVVPSQESNPGLPYSKPTRYQLSHAAPYWATPHHNWATPHHNWATPHHSEPRRTILSHATPRKLLGN